ncbi:rod-binding protein [Ferruginivarius sediminum]|uniref:Flagellar protein FlgJ N-terminal domain-containing protein n=1 Tax=Ferruginivarius sediminum TaxID=2661937 RepID=A0A369TGD1_9PROT|nr:rod-binding protein [Ferruginivarius sediminum]RDD63654.1 hypothetical protein DRB17_00255 [Ferruginivarius sediminum]
MGFSPATGGDISLLLQQQGQADKNSATAAARKTGGAPAQHAVREAAEDFEAMFLAQMLRPIFEGVETDAMFGGGPGEKAYKQLLVDEYGKAIARAGGVGIADSVQSEILKLQEVK